MIPKVEEITPEIIALAGDAGSKLGTGGMATKIMAAQIAKACGTDTIIASGGEISILKELLQGEEIGTWFTT